MERRAYSRTKCERRKARSNRPKPDTKGRADFESYVREVTARYVAVIMRGAGTLGLIPGSFSDATGNKRRADIGIISRVG